LCYLLLGSEALSYFTPHQLLLSPIRTERCDSSPFPSISLSFTSANIVASFPPFLTASANAESTLRSLRRWFFPILKRSAFLPPPLSDTLSAALFRIPQNNDCLRGEQHFLLRDRLELGGDSLLALLSSRRAVPLYVPPILGAGLPLCYRIRVFDISGDQLPLPPLRS